MSKRNLYSEITAAIFILLFVYTACSKLLDRNSFQLVLSVSPLIGKKAIFVSYAIPIIEIVLAILLLVPKTRMIGFIAAGVLMTLFTLYIAFMLIFTPQLPCSCGGVLKQMSWKTHLIFNIGFTLLAIAGYVMNKNTQVFTAVNRLSRTPV